MRKLTIALLTLVLLAACTKQSQTLKIGIIKPSIDHLPLSYGMQKGLFDSSQYSLVSFTSGWEVQEALVAGKLDVAILPFTYVWNAASKGFPLKTVSFFERETDAIITQKEITAPAQLCGKRIGLLKASSLDVLWRDYAMREKINAETVYFRSPNEAVAALQNRDVDAVVLYVPIVTKIAADYNVLHWFSESYPAHPCCDIAVNTNAIGKGKLKLLKSFIAELEGSVAKLYDNSDDMIAYLKQEYGVTEELCFDAIHHTAFGMGLDDSGKEFEQKMAAVSKEAGYLDRIPTLQEVFWDFDDK
ncbi:MAG: transporter substrate-binding domain-containing protein [Candidatus Cloacimonetes bacterium]|nr:transporter substrate-binding domain-containing protein [Candidatus Cloacimonadota bacterium]